MTINKLQINNIIENSFTGFQLLVFNHFFVSQL